MLGTGLDLQRTGFKVASGCGLVVKLSAGLDTLVVRPSPPFPEVRPPGCEAQPTGRARKEESATHHRGRDVQGAVAPGRAPGSPGHATSPAVGQCRALQVCAHRRAARPPPHSCPRCRVASAALLRRHPAWSVEERGVLRPCVPPPRLFPRGEPGPTLSRTRCPSPPPRP